VAGDDFRGIGWAFPVDATGEPEQPGEIELARLEHSIKESILLILATSRGERVMRPTFGCSIAELVFAPNDAVTASRLTYEVRRALVEWEPRIDVLMVEAVPDAADVLRLFVLIEYRVRDTNSVFNLVYPFYLEGSGVR
jgi:phage baseplate assembly protein W